MVYINSQENKLDVSILGNFKENLKEILKIVSIEGEASVAFTGNRPASLPWKYNENCDMFLDFKKGVKYFLEELIKKGVNKFITGMAMGFDMIMAEIVIELKKDYAVELEGAIPCLNQTEKWSADFKRRYQNILDKLDKVTVVSNKKYFNGCFHIRNHYMVDSSDFVIAGSFASSGGTVATVNYSLKKNKPIIVFGK